MAHIDGKYTIRQVITKIMGHKHTLTHTHTHKHRDIIKVFQRKESTGD